jgi:thioredoxin reductase (NADPH)
MAELGLDQRGLPLVIFPDGTHLSKPSLLELAEKAGLQTEPARDSYDLIVVGAGPAGLAAAVSPLQKV